MKKKIIFALSGLVPLPGLFSKDPTLLIYSLFVFAFFLRLKFVSFISKINLSAASKFALLVILSGFLTETFAWLGEFLQRAPEPKLLHPQLIPDLISSVGFYGSWAVAWILLLKRYQFTLPQVFILQGLYGVLIEQRGAVFLTGLSGMPLGLIFWLYVFLVYGSAIGLPYLLTKDQFISQGKSNSKFKYLPAFILMFVSSLVILMIWGLLTGWFLPQPKPIWESPLW